MIGATFCQVIKIKLFIQVEPSITPGNQKWKGAAPNLIRRAVVNNIKTEIVLV